VLTELPHDGIIMIVPVKLNRLIDAIIDLVVVEIDLYDRRAEVSKTIIGE